MATSIAVLPESIAVDDAAQRALSLVNKFANDSNFCNNNPDDVFAELDHARNNVLDAWKTLELAVQREQQQQQNNNSNNLDSTIADTTRDLRPAFMDMITDAFGDVLEELRSSNKNGDKNSEEIDVSVLVDCLQSGYDLFVAAANDENDFSWGKLEEEDDDDEDNDQYNDEVEEEEEEDDDDNNNNEQEAQDDIEEPAETKTNNT